MAIRCIYCGENKVIHSLPSSRFFLAGFEDLHARYMLRDIYKCVSCGIQFTHLELERTEANGNKANAGCAVPSEEEMLGQAWELMRQSRWDDALDILLQKSYPLEHPLEFSFYRGICQTAPLLLCDRDDLEKRYQKLDLLLNNLNSLDYYLEKYSSPEDCSATLKRLYEALMLLGSLPVKRHINCVINAPVYYTNQIRASILSYYADYLELNTLGNKTDSTEYFKMSVQLLHKCLELAREKKSLLPYREHYLNLPSSERRVICDRIKQLNIFISLKDPHFTVKAPPPGPWVIKRSSDQILKFLVIIVGYFLAVGALCWHWVPPLGNPENTRDFLIANGMVHGCVLIVVVYYIMCERKHENDGALRQQRTAKRSCLYCGKNKLTAFVSPLDLPLEDKTFYLRCSNCGVCCCQAESDRERKAVADLKKDPTFQRTEEAIFKSSWQMMQIQSWDAALHDLFLKVYPYEHPLEFKVFRSVCQAAKYFMYPTTEAEAAKLSNYYHLEILQKRYESLETLQESWRCLDYYLPSSDPDDNFPTLKRLYEALLMLGSLTIKDCSHCYSEHHPYSVIDHTPYKRLTVLKGFAEHLFSRAEGSEHFTDYLKMALELLSQCLTVKLRVKGEIQQIALENYSPVYELDRLQIEEMMQQLNDMLVKADPSFTPIKPQVCWQKYTPDLAAKEKEELPPFNFSGCLAESLNAFAWPAIFAAGAYCFFDDFGLAVMVFLFAAAITSKKREVPWE